MKYRLCGCHIHNVPPLSLSLFLASGVSESDMEVSQMSMPTDSLEKEFKSDEMKQKLEKIKEKKNKFKKLYEVSSRHPFTPILQFCSYS